MARSGNRPKNPLNRSLKPVTPVRIWSGLQHEKSSVGGRFMFGCREVGRRSAHDNVNAGWHLEELCPAAFGA